MFRRRLNEGGNVALYELGFLDDGYPLGLSDSDLQESLATLRRLAAAAHCTLSIRRLQQGECGTTAEAVLTRDAVDLKPPVAVSDKQCAVILCLIYTSRVWCCWVLAAQASRVY